MKTQNLKTSRAYNLAGFKITKKLVEEIKQSGIVMPKSLLSMPFWCRC